MLPRLILAFFLIGFIFSGAAFAQNPTFTVNDIAVRVEAENAVKAKDDAILLAQRQGLAKLIGRDVDKIKDISDIDISRLVSGFSLKNERLAGRSYAAVFTMRFDPARTQILIQDKGFDLIEQAATSDEGLVETPVMPKTILVLPILDIGSRRVLWDDPNPWRDVWQKRDPSIKGLNLRVPLGDIADIRDVPDAQFLNGDVANVPDILSRYSSERMYVAVVKSQGAALDPSGGIVMSLYEHDGNKLNFIKKTILHPRAGYAFADAVAPTVQMIVMAENNAVPADEEESNNGAIVLQNPDQDLAPPVQNVEPSAPAPLVVTVPYQSLAQWVNIQKRLRIVGGVQNIVPVRVSPSSAQVEIVTTLAPATLTQNLGLQGFVLQAMPNGELALTER